jgi:UPF0755 protein
VAKELSQEKLINSETLFRLYSRFDKRASQIKVGRYQLSKNLTMGDLLDKLSKGPESLHITFVEGLRREQLAAEFSKVAYSSTAYQEFMTASQGVEGYLFPDTYFVAQQIEAKELVALLSKTFEERVTTQTRNAFGAHGLSLSQAVVMASLVEREAVSETDRALVAGVLYNRLKNSWPLDIDASIQYAVSSLECVGQKDCNWWPSSLSAADLKIDSPFNTYTNPGLPPRPICNPSLSALMAVANPTVSDYYFYVSDKQGALHFAKTLEEHNANIARYL